MPALNWIGLKLDYLEPHLKTMFERLTEYMPGIDWLKMPYMAQEPGGIPKNTLAAWRAIVSEALQYLRSFTASPSNFNAGMSAYLNNAFPGIFPYPGSQYHSNAATASTAAARAMARSLIGDLIAQLDAMESYLKTGVQVEKEIIEMPDPILPIHQLLDVPVVNPDTGETAIVETGVHLGLTNKNIAEGGDPNFDQQGAVQGALNAVAATLPAGWKVMPKEQGGINIAAFNAPGAGKFGVMGWALLIGGGLVLLRFVAGGGDGRRRGR